ncbi:MAG TPA: LacI family transcriptional regulator [Candidatus Alistipes excrementipullorum]|nr:LacI family transcriptional regulator [Candidatus Alistipes excrementipullorum]
MEKKNTIISISERTGFSVSTVSRVLNGKAEIARISKSTVEAIEQEAKRCNYKPSLLAKGLRTNKTNTIGLVIPSMENIYFANLASTIIRDARSYGYTIVTVDTMENERNERDGIESLLARKVDGIIVTPCGQDPEWLENINRNTTPVVLIDRYFNSTELSYVCTDNYLGGYEATKYLLNNGHEKILCIQGTPHSMPVRERVRGYLDALRSKGIESYASIVGDSFSIQNGYLETKLALSSASRPTAIFALSNTILLGAIKAIKESGLSIPNDISIITFDNNTFLDFIDPPITRMSQPVNEIGTLSVKLLMQSINEKKPINNKLQLQPQLIVCESVSNILMMAEQAG